MFYYDLVRFLHERLRSESSSTYVYYYTYPPIVDLENVLQRIPNLFGYFVEFDLIWGIPFFNRTNQSQMNLSYTPKEIELSLQMIRYWTNFAKTGKKYFLEENNIFVIFKEIQMNQMMVLFIGRCMNKLENLI
jgi:carboxylesterase type B